ncbi:MAG: hypothetical protein ACYTG1_06920, partial [Planctomycetota bacterium]
MLTAPTLRLLALLVLPAAPAEPPADTGRWLGEAYAGAVEATNGYRALGRDGAPPDGATVLDAWDRMADAWDEFQARIVACREHGLAVDPPWEARSFQVPATVGGAGWETHAMLRQALDPDDFLAIVDVAAGSLADFLDQLDGPGPDHVGDDASDAAAHHRAELLLTGGDVRAALGRAAAARAAWTGAADLARATIEAIVGHRVDDPPARPPGRPASRWLHHLTVVWLQAVERASGPRAMADAAEHAYAWIRTMPEDHSNLTMMRRAAQRWARDGVSLAEADRLATVVRTAHREMWDGRYAHMIDNVGASFVSIRVALADGDLARAGALLDELESIEGIPEWNRARLARLRALLELERGLDRDPSEALLAYLDDLLRQRRGDGPGAVAPPTAPPGASGPAV